MTRSEIEASDSFQISNHKIISPEETDQRYIGVIEGIIELSDKIF